MTRYYFAGAYERRTELKAYADQLAATRIGTSVVSRWLYQDQAGEDAGFSVGDLIDPGAVTRAWAYARRDIEDLSIAQVVVSFTGQGVRGGRHVEFGYALTIAGSHDSRGTYISPRLVIIGPREHVCHCHPDAEVYKDFAAFLRHEPGA